MFVVFEKKNMDLRRDDFFDTLNKTKQTIKALIRQKEKSFESFAIPYWMANERLGWSFHPISHLNSVKNTLKSQKVYAKVLEAYTEYSTALMQDEKLFQAFSTIKDQEYESLQNEQKTALDQLLLDFKLGGVGLDEKTKERLASIDLKLSELQNQFSQNVLNDTNNYQLIITDENDIHELPESDKTAARFTENGVTKYRFTLHQPSYLAFMTYGSNRLKREELYKAYVTRGHLNQSLIDEILSLRQEQAKLLGFENFAQLSLSTKDAPDTKTVIDFLQQLATKSRPYALQQKQELEAFAASHGCQELQSYDLAYFSEKLRKAQYDIDEEFYRPYFESTLVVEGMFSFMEELFGIEIKKASPKTWEQSVLVYDFYEDGKVFGRLYLDLESRKNKRGGAWMDNASSYCLDEQGHTWLPVAYIVCNFPPATKSYPSLLKHSDVETLFHEMGHAMHHLFSKVKSVTVSGVNGVAWDVVEFPSQFFEQFVFENDVLSRFAFHYQTGEKLSPEAIQKLKNARNFQAALGMVRQVEFALFDFLIHTPCAEMPNVQQILDTVRHDVAVFIPPQYNKFQHSFTHIFSGGYAAGYYSYKWAEVLSADLFMSMTSQGSINNDLATRYKESVLTWGGSISMRQMFFDLMGRERDNEAILKLYGLCEG